eukprot:766334-Prorocentrum_minimum.AAC.2
MTPFLLHPHPILTPSSPHPHPILTPSSHPHPILTPSSPHPHPMLTSFWLSRGPLSGSGGADEPPRGRAADQIDQIDQIDQDALRLTDCSPLAPARLVLRFGGGGRSGGLPVCAVAVATRPLCDGGGARGRPH